MQAQPVAPGHGHDEETADDPSGDLAYYDAYPMSRIPHRVVRGWGLGSGSSSPGRVGAFVVVDPSISDEALEQLARDIRRYHESADAVSVRIVDLERAATYDRHEDGGALREQRMVGRVQRNDRLELDEIVLRGRTLETGS